MRKINVGPTAVRIVPPGERDFLHIHNVGGGDVRLGFDGDPDTITAGIGLVVPSGKHFFMDNTWKKQIMFGGIHAIAAAGEDNDLRIQGVYTDEDLIGEITAYLAAVDNLGGSLSDVQLAAVKALHTSIIESDLNGYIRFIAPIVGDGINAASVALRNFPGRSLQMPITGFTDDDYAQATGITGNNAGYLDTNFTQDDFDDLGLMHIGIHHVLNDSTDGQCFFGSVDTSGSVDGIHLKSGATGVQIQYTNAAADTPSQNASDEGHLVGLSDSNNASNNEIFRDGSTVNAATVTVSTGSAQEFYLMALNAIGPATAIVDGGTLQFAHAGDRLTAAQIAALDTIIDTYGTALGW